MLEGSTFVTRYRISPALLENARKSRISVEHLVSVKVSRRIFNEQLSNQRSPRYADHFVTSAGQLISERNSKRSVERLTHTRNSRISERLASDTNSRHSVERLTSRRDSIRIISERDFRYSVRLSASIRNFRTSAERLISYTESRHSFERFAPVRANRKTAHKGDSISSVEHLTSVRKSKISAEQTLERISRCWVKHLASVIMSKISAERLASNRHLIDQLVSVRDFRRSTERNVRQSDGRLATMMDSRIYAEKLATKRDFRRFESLTSLKNAQRKPTEGASIVRNSRRTTVNQLRNSVRIAHERQSLYIKSSPDRLANRRLMSTAFNRLTRPISDRHVSQLKPISTIHITSKILNDHGIMRMSNVRNTGLPDGYISNNQTLDQGLRLSEKQFKATDNTTLKTESSTDIGLLFGSVQTSTLSPTQFSSWSDKAIEYTKCGLTTLTMMWPSIAIWKGETLKSLAGFDVISAFSSEMDHFNNFFADKPTSNYAHVPDDLAFFHSTKATPPVMRDRNRILPTVIRGGVTAAFMLLSTKSK
ncbi:uncharacterized protein LOC110836179 [Zootermopsis nevadensis]|uniref:Uncharacterized protein n=1 Tax=Zootermopsis nevadensis TaxID=136037 RepID=A0A067R3P1_ZOONE|nr:uncharacterized protein LOC110836179 [Zootermopsis nevadensis]KDR12494.1 hypothetical protein L798_13738 [Zootermopsis nevadensis]